MLRLYSSMSLTAKLAAIFVSINLVGLVIFTTYTWNDQTRSTLETASASRKWGKAEAVREAYVIYRDAPSPQLLQLREQNSRLIDENARGQEAAMVEETNAASQYLMSQGQILKNAVSRFVLSATPITSHIKQSAAPKIRNVAGTAA